jgi:hypothetical protein
MGFEAAPVVTRNARGEARMLKLNTNTGKRASSPAVWALALVLGAPALVQAQTQLFPLAPIQRHRVPCPMEDPVYGLYRHQYWGYFPTCWRTFPPGWGCPSSESPDVARAFQERPREKLPPLPPEGGELAPLPPGEEQPPAPGMRGRTPPPLPPTERSPFEIDTAPRPTPPAGGPAPGGANPTIPPGASRVDPPQALPGAVSTGNGASAPVLALPDPTESAPMPTPPELSPAPVATRPAETSNLTPPPATVETPMPMPAGVPVQAPQRRGPLSSIFNGMTSFLRR